jgi:hypothetical protein
MRKILFIVILLLFLTGCSEVSHVSEIEAVNLQNGDTLAISKGNKDADLILNAVSKKDRTNKDVSSLLNYQITLKKDDKQEDVYTLFFDLEDQTAYLKKGEALYKIRDSAAKPLFLSHAFSYIYVSAMYDSYIELKGEEFRPYLEYNWNSKNIEGHFVNNRGIESGKYEDTKISLSPNDYLDIKHEKQPDNQTIRIYDRGTLINTGKQINPSIKPLQEDTGLFPNAGGSEGPQRQGPYGCPESEREII